MSRKHTILRQANLFIHNNKCILILEIATLFSLALIYLYFVLNYFVTRPMPGGSDAMFYLTPAIWGSNIGAGSMTLIDRLVPLVGLRLSCLLIQPAFTAGASYILLINILIVLIAVYWAYVKKGFYAGLFVGILLITSYSFLYNATNVYTDQTMTLFCLLAFVFFASKYKAKIFDPTLMAGIFSAFACFSKLPGGVIFVFFIVWIIMEKQWTKLLRLLLGFAAGTVLVLLTYSLSYGFDSLKYVVFHSSRNWATFSILPSQMRSQYVFYAYQYYLPIFISLIIFIGAYKNKLVRPLFLVSIFFIVFSLFVALVMDMYALNDNYTYPLLVFTSIGLGIYIAILLDDNQIRPLNKLSPLYKNTKFKLIIAFFCITGIIISFIVGISHYTTFVNLSSPSINHLLFHIFPLIPIVTIGLMVLIEYSKSAVFSLLFMLLISFWCPAYNGALAYNNVTELNSLNALMYSAPPVFNNIPAKEFSVYVESWNSDEHVKEIPRFYANFFNEKYTKVIDDATYNNIMYKIFMVTDSNDLSKAIECGQQILTDTPDHVKHFFPAAEAKKEIPWESEKMYLMDLNLTKIPLYQSDFSSWKESQVIGLNSFNKTASPLRIHGNKGSFQFEKVAANGNSIIRVKPMEGQAPGEKLLMISYVIERNKSDDDEIYICLNVNSRISTASKSNEMSIFIQDNGTEKAYDLKELAAYEYSFAETSIVKKINSDATQIWAGIIFRPETEQSWLEIKDMAVYDVTP